MIVCLVIGVIYDAWELRSPNKLLGLVAAALDVPGPQPDDRLRRHMQLARAFVFDTHEDFGIAVVEAQACGTPVFGRGGATKTVVGGRTGILFAEQTPSAIMATVERFGRIVCYPMAIRRARRAVLGNPFPRPIHRSGATGSGSPLWPADTTRSPSQRAHPRDR